MQQETADRAESIKLRAFSNAQEEALSPQQQARDAASGVPGRRNRPSSFSSKQQKKRLRHAYAAYSHLPKELQDNEFITSGYRVDMGFWDSIKSLFGLHNETGNIWTHLIGTVSEDHLVRTRWSGQHLHTLAQARKRPNPCRCAAYRRFHAVPDPHTGDSICQTSSASLGVPAACWSGKSALSVCAV